MGRYSLAAAAIPTGAVVGTYVSLIGLKAANTLGHRGRLRSIFVGGAGGVPQDKQVSCRIVLTDNNADGTSTAQVPNPLDPNNIASIMTGKETYTVEPTNVATPAVWQGPVNGRGTISKEWAPGEGPLWGQNQTLLLQGTPGEAFAVTLDCTLEWDENL